MWFFKCIAPDFLQSIGNLVTKSAHNEYYKETFPFQDIRCYVNVREIRKSSFYLDFCFCNPKDQNTVFSRGYQQIVFVNKDKKIIRFPLEVLNKIKEYSL